VGGEGGERRFEQVNPPLLMRMQLVWCWRRWWIRCGQEDDEEIKKWAILPPAAARTRTGESGELLEASIPDTSTDQFLSLQDILVGCCQSY
jgi:hypothetical protein